MRPVTLALVSCLLSPGLQAQFGFINEFGDAGELVTTAQPAGSVTQSAVHSAVMILVSNDDVDMWRYRVPNHLQASASTDVPITQAPTGVTDTQLYLFDCEGRGISHNDDISASNLRSAIGSQHMPGPGVYHCAVTSYGNRPKNIFGQFIWDPQGSPTGVRAPDGPGAAFPYLASWDHQGTESGNTGTMLTGATELGPGVANSTVIGLGCGGVQLSADTLPVLGASYDCSLTSPGPPGISVCLARTGSPSLFAPLPSPFQTGCLAYLGNLPTVNLGMSTQTVPQWSIPIPNSASLSGLPLMLQAARIDPSPLSIRTSNGLLGVIGTCN